MEENARGTDLNANEYEFNSYWHNATYDSLFNCSIYDYFEKDVIERVVRDPIRYHEEAIRLSEVVYNSNGIVSNSIDYCTSLMTLDRVITCANNKQKSEKNRNLMNATLRQIDDRAFIRDALFTEMLTGIGFYYFDVRDKKSDSKKLLTDSEVYNIYEINELGLNVSIITLPWQYTKIVGKKNGRYVLAFNLEYFTEFTGESLDKKLRKYPKEITSAWEKNKTKSNKWVVLDNNHTMCGKIKARNVEPWGRSLIIAALHDVLYNDYFTDTKRNTLDEVNKRIVFETFPENKQGTGSSLTRTQQEAQHNVIKSAINNRGKNGVTFFSLAAGTKMDSINVDTDIFDSKNEENLKPNIALDLGISAALIGAMSTGTYSGNVNNLEMITAQLYSWICEWKNELVHVINATIIKDKKNPVDIYYFPTSFVNRKEFFDMMKTLYSEASGSLKFLIAASGVDPEVYMSVMDSEIAEGIYDKYTPHQTSYTISSKDSVGGRPTTDNPSDNTVKSQNNNGNSVPSPSDK